MLRISDAVGVARAFSANRRELPYPGTSSSAVRYARPKLACTQLRLCGFTTLTDRQVDQNREKCLRRDIRTSRSFHVDTDNVEIVRLFFGMDG